MEFLLAIQFLTRIPITIRGSVTEKNLARSMAFYPVVGLALGGMAALLHYLLGYMFSGTVRDFVIISFLIFVTGNMHMDALMDTADGFFSGKPKDGILEIMKDSRVGSHGVVAGILAILGKLIFLGQIPPDLKLQTLVIVPALGRWALVYGSARYPYARIGGGTGGFTEMVGTRELTWTTITAAVASVILLGWNGLVLVLVALIGIIGLYRFICQKIGGVTGDTLGATNECIEILCFAAIPLLPKITGILSL